jgi:uncharacterized membrane protein
MPDRETRSIIVKADAQIVYNTWASFEQFPRFMQHIASVQKTGPRTSHWVMAGPLGRKVEWDAETTRLEENKRIAWSSKDGRGFTTSGEALFNALSHGETQITVTLQYIPPAGWAGEIVSELFANPGKMLEQDLRHFKAYVEGLAAPLKANRSGSGQIASRP